MGTFLIAATVLALASPVTAWSEDPSADLHGQRPQARPDAAGGQSEQQGFPTRADWSYIGPYGGDAEDVAVSPASPQIVLAGLAPSGAPGGLYRSTDGGDLWTSVDQLEGTKVYDIAFTSTGVAYLATENSVWKSTNDGIDWTMLNLHIGSADCVYDVTINPSDESIVWAGIAASPGYQSVSVMRSADAGASWEDRSPPLGEPMECRSIAVNPNSRGRIYACFGGWFSGGQVWVSNDSGMSWRNRSAGLPGNPLYDLAHDGSRVLVGGGQMFLDQQVGLYASTNEGLTWTPLHDATWPVRVVNDVELEPGNPSGILVASAQGGVFRSSDGGDSWTIGIGGTALLSLNSVRFAPGNPSIIFLGAESNSVYRSTDGGDSFLPSSQGINQLSLYSIDANPLAPEEIAAAFQAQSSGGCSRRSRHWRGRHRTSVAQESTILDELIGGFLAVDAGSHRNGSVALE